MRLKGTPSICFDLKMRIVVPEQLQVLNLSLEDTSDVHLSPSHGAVKMKGLHFRVRSFLTKGCGQTCSCHGSRS